MSRIIDDLTTKTEFNTQVTENTQEHSDISTDIAGIQESKTDLSYTDTQLALKASQADLLIERGRIDLLVAPPAGVDNAETADIRIGVDGTEYDSAGAAVRTQINDNITQIYRNRYQIFNSAVDLITIDTNAKTVTNKEFTLILSDGYGGKTILAGSTTYTIGFFDAVTYKCRSIFVNYLDRTLYVAAEPAAVKDILICSFDDPAVYADDETKKHIVFNGSNIIPTYIKTTDFDMVKDIITIFDGGIDLITIDTAAKTVVSKQFTFFDATGKGRLVNASTVPYTIDFYVSNKARSLFINGSNNTLYVASQMVSTKDYFVCSFSDTVIFAPDEITRHIILNTKLPVIPKRIYSIHDAFNQWADGAKFPAVVIGDSTVDGYRTTDYAANVIGSDHISPYLFTKVLETLLRSEFGNNQLRIYNSGFTGQTASWAVTNFEALTINNANYADAKICFISMGINGGPSSVSTYATFLSDVEKLIGKCYKNKIQPVLLTTQAGMENYNRLSTRTISYADKAKLELAEKYGLEIIDINKFTQHFNVYSTLPASAISSDMCHYNDAGHAYEAGVFFAHIVPRTIWIDTEDIIGFNRQERKSSLQFSDYIADADKEVVNLVTPVNGFKQHAIKRTGTADIAMMDIWIFNNSKTPLDLVAYCESVYSQYVTVDGTNYTITGTEQNLCELDIGLHHMVAMTGTNNNINWLGFKLVNPV